MQWIKKLRHDFDNKSLYSQSYGFSSSHVWIWELDHKESWGLENWRRLLRVPWTAMKSNQSILKEINPEYSLEGLMLKLKLEHLGYLMWRSDSLGKTLMLKKIEGKRKRASRGWDGWMASLTQWAWVWASSGRWWRAGNPGVLQSVGSQRVGHSWATEQQCLLGVLLGSESYTPALFSFIGAWWGVPVWRGKLSSSLPRKCFGPLPVIWSSEHPWGLSTGPLPGTEAGCLCTHSSTARGWLLSDQTESDRTEVGHFFPLLRLQI